MYRSNTKYYIGIDKVDRGKMSACRFADSFLSHYGSLSSIFIFCVLGLYFVSLVIYTETLDFGI